MGTNMKYFTSNDGFQLAYQDVGDVSLPPLILLHGFTGSSRVFQRNIPLLSPYYRIIAPDLRGHGASAKTPHGFHVSRLAMDLHNLIFHLALFTPHSVRVIAGSLGCSILWCYAELFTPDIWKAMVWVDQSPMQNFAFDGTWGADVANRGMHDEAAVKGLFEGMKEDPEEMYRETVNACLSYRSHPLPGQTKALDLKKWEDDEKFFVDEAKRGDPMWYAQLMKNHTALDWRTAITECFGRMENRTTVLVVASSRSGCFPAKGPLEAVKLVNKKLEKGRSKAEGVTVDWGGHWCYWEEPEIFNKLVLEFLGRE